MPFDVLLVDDHKIMRDGLRAILSRAEEFRVVGEAGQIRGAGGRCRQGGEGGPMQAALAMLADACR